MRSLDKEGGSKERERYLYRCDESSHRRAALCLLPLIINRSLVGWKSSEKVDLLETNHERDRRRDENEFGQSGILTAGGSQSVLHIDIW